MTTIEMNAPAQTAMRFLYGPVHMPITDIRDIITSKYEAQPPWLDFGFTKSGFQIENKVFQTQLSLRDENSLLAVRDMRRGTFAWAVMWQDDNKVIHGVIWPRVKIIRLTSPDPPRGESSTWLLTLEIMSQPTHI